MAGNTERSSLTPQQRLANSRRALVRQLQGGEARDHGRQALDGDTDDELEYAHHDASGELAHERHASRRDGNSIWGGVARSVVQRWWRRHPAHAMGQLARPLLEHYARKEPAKLIAAAAATGALLVLVKPWRLLSVTAVLAAVLKTSDVADVVNTLMQKNPSSPRKDPT
ncbi:hypothetical protein J2W28_000403 [Variovorax boronicumulans]|uniref:hypothetical protein n=1 Tax=Variovorax boronicumulans TaxID=436515 RepID=UPI00278AED7A|nr:hypothetical protein [Variovorax boronicumulans]MDP9990217.1 hypothetical protein [Variovorax boronicumulans]MDQ0001275.1 hypothetical protein [Variovorax boronicumulans]